MSLGGAELSMLDLECVALARFSHALDMRLSSVWPTYWWLHLFTLQAVNKVEALARRIVLSGVGHPCGTRGGLTTCVESPIISAVFAPADVGSWGIARHTLVVVPACP